MAYPSNVLCPNCGAVIDTNRCHELVVCSCGAQFPLERNLLFLSAPETLEQIPEAATRDREASQYLKLPKFPTQLDSVVRFIDTLPPELKAFAALDLGCGPGPTTALLLQRGYRVVGVDFSAASLRLNASLNAEHGSRVMFVA